MDHYLLTLNLRGYDHESRYHNLLMFMLYGLDNFRVQFLTNVDIINIFYIVVAIDQNHQLEYFTRLTAQFLIEDPWKSYTNHTYITNISCIEVITNSVFCLFPMIFHGLIIVIFCIEI